MKKLISLILVALLLCLALPAMAEEEITGDWFVKTMKEGDQEYDAASIGYAMTLTLNDDGTVVMAIPGQEASVGTWTLEGDRITVTINDSPVSGTVSDGVMDLEQDGMELIFTREAVEAIAVAEIKAAEAAEAFYGEWTCAYADADGMIVDIAVADMGRPNMSISETAMTFSDEEDGLLAFLLNMAKLGAPSFGEGKLTVNAGPDAPNPEFSATVELLEDGMTKLTMITDTPLVLYFTPAQAAAAGAGEGYVYEGTSFSIKTEELPTNYPCLPEDKFVAGFKSLVDGTITTASTYEDVAKAFGDEGIRMAGIQYEGYAYYSWYSEKDYTGGTKVHVLVTFKVKDGVPTYYAYSAEGITPQDVK